MKFLRKHYHQEHCIYGPRLEKLGAKYLEKYHKYGTENIRACSND